MGYCAPVQCHVQGEGVWATKHVLEGHTDAVNWVSWSPDGNHLASAAADDTVRIWSADGGSALWVLEGHTGWVQTVVWSPDGRHLASGSDDASVRVWAIGAAGAKEAGAAVQVTLLRSEGSDSVTSVAWSPDGRRLASASWDGTRA